LLHFEPLEYAVRLKRAKTELAKANLDALLIFAPESQYWLCGYDTFGYAMFQCLVLSADGKLDLITRAPDMRQAQFTSTLKDHQIHIWPETADTNPAEHLKALLDARGITGNRIGIETKTAGLTMWNGGLVANALGDRLIEASDIISRLRAIKSAAEIDHIRKAASLTDDAFDAALEVTHAGAFEGDILAAMQGAVFRGGGEYAGNDFILGSGAGALLCRSYAGRRHLDASDQLTLEWSGSFARYHAAAMRTIVIGTPSEAQRRMHGAARKALEACEAAIRPGAPMSDVYDAHARVFDGNGLSHARLQACGYSMGLAYPPIWVEFPMFTSGNRTVMRAGQAFFLHMILMDSETGQAMCLGHTVLLTETGAERLSRHGLDLISL